MSDEEAAAFFIVGLLVAALYALPTFVAFFRGHPNRWLIFVVNLVFGGTGLGWLVALVWAFHAIHRSKDPHGSHGGESGLNLTVNDPIRVELRQPMSNAHKLDSRLNELKRLKQLRDEGTIDQMEFEALRRHVLAAS